MPTPAAAKRRIARVRAARRRRTPTQNYLRRWGREAARRAPPRRGDWHPPGKIATDSARAIAQPFRARSRGKWRLHGVAPGADTGRARNACVQCRGALSERPSKGEDSSMAARDLEGRTILIT